MDTQLGELNTADTMVYAPVYAGFFRRALAFIIDYILFFVVMSFLAPLMVGGITFQSVDRGDTDWFMWFMLALVCLYSAAMESSPLQATVGKLVMGIQVTSMDGKRISFVNALARAGVKILSVIFLFIGCIVAAFTEKRQALHDFPTGSLVVRKGLTREIPNVSTAGYGQVQTQDSVQNRGMPADQTQGRPVLEEWSTGGALIKATFDKAPAIITAEFHKTLADALTKAGLPLHNADSGDQIQVSGNFILIDQGNRALRYFTNGMMGKARVEVEGGLLVNGARAANLLAKAERGLVFVALGGDNQKVLLMCAADCGLKIAKQVVEALKPSQGVGRV